MKVQLIKDVIYSDIIVKSGTILNIKFNDIHKVYVFNDTYALMGNEFIKVIEYRKKKLERILK